MGIGDWFKKTFGKQTCAFCGQEVGVMKRDKIKNNEFICSDCRLACSRYFKVYRYTKDQILEHMDYMKMQKKLVESARELKHNRIPDHGKQGIIFYDELGMLRVCDTSKDNKYPLEMIRYDQIASYEEYVVETEPAEAGKEKEFKEGGVKITLVGCETGSDKVPEGLRAHPYIDEVITVKLEEKDMVYADVLIKDLNDIFGVFDDRRGLFRRGPSKQEKREGEAIKAVGSMFTAALKAAKDGTVSEEDAAKVTDAMNKMDDAATRGLARFSRLADEAEARMRE